MIIILLVVIAFALIAIFSALTAKQRAEDKARRKQLRREALDAAPGKFLARVLLVIVSAIVAWFAVSNGATFWGTISASFYVAVPGLIIIEIIFAIVGKNEARKAETESATGQATNHSAPVKTEARRMRPGADAWRGLPPGRRVEFVDEVLQAIYMAGARTIPKLRPTIEYVREIDERYEAHKGVSREPFGLVSAVLDIVGMDNAQDRGIEGVIVKLADAVRTQRPQAFGLPAEPIESITATDAASVEIAKQDVGVRLSETPSEQEEIVRVTQEAVYGMGASWIPKNRSPREYLHEIERRWRARNRADRVPIRLSHAVLDVVRDDCAGHPKVLKVLIAIDRAMNADLPEDAILFQEAATSSPN